MKIKNLAQSINTFGKFSFYVQGLLTNTKRKTCMQMALALCISHDTLQRILGKYLIETDVIDKYLFSCVKKYQTIENPGYLVIDDTCIPKPYATIMHGIEYVYNSILGRTIKGFSYLFIVWTNGKITIPLGFIQWVPKDLCDDNQYKKKCEIAQILINQVKDKKLCKKILLDGLYQSYEMMIFINQLNFDFYMRLPRNRTVSTTEKERPVSLKIHKKFHLKRNQRSKTWKAYIKGISCYITAEKRKKRNGDYETVYIVSNRRHHSPKKIIAIYNKRWFIEKFFRTSKQSLGLQDCQAISIQKQNTHITAICVAYTVLEDIKIKKKLSSSEKALKYFQHVTSNTDNNSKPSAGEYFNAIA